MRRILITLAAVVVLAGCGNSNADPVAESDRLSTLEITTPHGPMLCVIYKHGYAGGLDCVPLGWDPADTAP